MLYSKVICIPQIILLLIGVAAPQRLSSKCTFAEKQYEVNQTWYKFLLSPSMCVRCTCRPEALGSVVNCFNISCNRATCETSKEECCEACLDAPTAEARTDVVGEKLPCLHSGRVFQHGEEFSSNATGLQTQNPNQCIHCICQSGLVLCRLKDCSECFPSHSKDCCPSCKEELLPSEQASQTNPVLMVSDGHSQSGDCIAAGITYSHGSSWHPVIGPFGPMDCVDCKCQNGKIECSRLNCQPIEKLPCPKPIQVPGHCCPLCTDEEPASHGVQPAKAHADVNCLPPQTNTLVFRSHASSSSSAYYQYAFQTLNGDTRLLTWTVKDGRIGDFSEQHLSKEEFKTLRGTFQFKLQGATRTKLMEKFIRKAKRLPDRCGGRCSVKIQHLGQVLLLKDVTRRPLCLQQELSFE